MFEKILAWTKAHKVLAIIIVIVVLGLGYTLVTTPACGTEEVSASGEG